MHFSNHKIKGMSDVSTMLKLVGFSGIGVAALPSVSDISVPLFGVPLPVVGMAVAGAFISIAYGQPERSRRKVFLRAFANAFLAAISVAVLPKMLGWEWVDPKLEPPLAAGAAILLKWIIPIIPEIMRKWFRLEKYDKTFSGGGTSDYSDYYDQGDSKDYYEPEVKRRANKRK